MALWGVQYFLQKVVGGKLNSVMSPCEGEKILESLRKLFVKFLKNVEYGEEMWIIRWKVWRDTVAIK